MKSRSVSNSPHLKEIKRKKYITFRNKALLYFLAVLAIFTGLGMLSRWEKINIDSMEIVGNKVVDTKAIEEVVEKNITGNYLWIFSKRNLLLYPKNKIKEDLSDTFKRLKDISFKIKNTQTLEISLSERKAIYTWCGESLPEEGVKLEEAKCYFMDDTGYIFDEAPYFSGEVYFRFFGKVEREAESPTGSSFLADKFQKLVSFTENLSNMQLKPSLLYLLPNSDIEIYLSSNNSISSSPKIMLKNDADLNKITENLQAAISTDPLKSDLAKKLSSLLYIDLRFGNKVYYKFK